MNTVQIIETRREVIRMKTPLQRIVAEWRRKSGMTQEQVAALIGGSSVYFGRIENGEKVPAVDYLDRMITQGLPKSKAEAAYCIVLGIDGIKRRGRIAYNCGEFDLARRYIELIEKHFPAMAA